MPSLTGILTAYPRQGRHGLEVATGRHWQPPEPQAARCGAGHGAVAVGAIADLARPLTFPAMSENNAQVGRPGPAEPDPRERLTFEQVLAEVGVTRSTMDKWRARGAAPRFKRLPNGNLISRREWLDQWFSGLEDDPRWPGTAA